MNHAPSFIDKARYKKHGGWTGLLIILKTFDIRGDPKLNKVKLLN